jgi:hypothetical protein
MEIWKDIEGFEGYNKISSKGRVKSVARKQWNGKAWHDKKEQILKNRDGSFYHYVKLCRDGFYKKEYVHRLVAQAFIPNPLNKKCVNHIDSNKLNNNLNNLEWVTHKENYEHYIKQK